MHFHLKQLFLRSYPSGMMGAGVLLLRLSISAGLLLDGISLPAIPGAVFVALGLLNPLSALLAAILIAASPNPNPASAATCLSLILIGPGAFSLDARLFGRREIVVPLPHSGYSKNVQSGDRD